MIRPSFSTFAALSLSALLVLSSCGGSSPETADVTSVDSHPLASYTASPTQQAGAVMALQRLFDALETGDAELLRSVVDPSVVMHFTELRDGETTFGSATLDGLATRITSSDTPLIERMWDPFVVVDGDLATIWTPYDFYSGTTFSHCGVDVATLMKTDDNWTIVALSWTRQQPPACDLHPDGPPEA